MIKGKTPRHVVSNGYELNQCICFSADTGACVVQDNDPHARTQQAGGQVGEQTDKQEGKLEEREREREIGKKKQEN